MSHEDAQPLTFAVGQVYPEDAGAPGEGAVARIVEGQGMWVLVKLHKPTNGEISAYTFGKIDFGVYSDASRFPWGLLLFGIHAHTGKMIHQEVPMGIVGERLVRPEAVESWLSGNANAFHLLLLDADTLEVKAIRQLGLQDDLVSRLQDVWRGQIDAGCSLETYNAALLQLQARFSTPQLWDASDRFRHTR